MKQRILLFALLTFAFLRNTAKANEVEPNNDRAHANTLALNGSNSGVINPSGDQDWWKVTTNADGQLNVTLTGLGGHYMSLYIYDNNGTTEITHADYIYPGGTLSPDGLAAGTYYIRVTCTNAADTNSYNISNTLTLTGIANDAEPDSTRTTALTLPLNGSSTGHVGYYYNLHRDSVDEYKVTTNQDGELDLTLTENVGGHYLSLYFYDNDGTTLLNHADYIYPGGTIKTDGLAAGTYYLKIYCTNINTEWDAYTIKDSLVRTGITNDVEPNGTKTQALTLPQNSSITGHVGYYYNHVRDTTDWYKVTTTEDGELDFTITENVGGHYISLYLYDNNGTTLLNHYDYIYPSNTLKTDGLAAGTYYVKVYCTNYNTEWDAYTLQDTLLKYNYANDTEPNGRPYQAKTIPSNGTITGHAGFFYNNVRDTFDWHKINYTGTSGSLNLTLNIEPSHEGIRYFSIYIYKDTNAADIYHADYIASTTTNISLTSLTQGYYYIRLYCTNYTYEFEAYSLSNSYTEVTKAKITFVSADTAADCSNTNSLTFKCSKSHSPYTVQLYRYNLKYRTINVKNTQAFTFDTLPHGVYYAKAYGDGATIFSKSATMVFIAKPASPHTTNITSTQAKLNWTTVSCASYYSVQYRKLSDTIWTTKNTAGNVAFLTIKNLAPSTTYLWRVASADSSNGVTGIGAYTDSVSFSTAAAFATTSSGDEENISIANGNDANNSATVYPNPAKTQFNVKLNLKTQSVVNLNLKTLNGNVVWNAMNVSSLNTTTVDASNLPNGMYILQVTDGNSKLVTVQKVIIEK